MNEGITNKMLNKGQFKRIKSYKKKMRSHLKKTIRNMSFSSLSVLVPSFLFLIIVRILRSAVNPTEKNSVPRTRYIVNGINKNIAIE